jgi:hypothetical protein
VGSRNIPTEAGGGDLNVAGRILLLALTVWALAMIVPGLHRVIDLLGSFGLSVDNDGVVTDVVAPFASATQSPAAEAGLVTGDRIDLKTMRCVPPGTPQCESLVAVLGGLGGMQSALLEREITLTIQPKDGAPTRTVTLESAPASLTFAERVVLLADTMVGVVVIVIAFWLVWTRPGWMTWGLFLYVMWLNPGQSETYYAVLQRWPIAVFAQEIMEALATGAAYAGLMIFALRFPKDRTEPRWQKVQWVALAVGVIMAALTLAGYANVFGYPTERITEVSFTAGLVVDAGVLVILLMRRRTLPPHEEQRMRWVIWGCAIGLPTFILAELCQSSDLIHHLWGAAPAPALIGLLYLPNGVLAYLASEAVWQHRVVSVSIPLRHGTIITALSLAVGVPIIQLHEKLAEVPESLELPGWVWPLVVAPVVLYVLNRLHEITVEIVDRVFNRRFHAVQRQLEEASEAIVHAKSLAEIDRMLVESAVTTLCLSSGAVFRCEGDGLRRLLDTKGWTPSLKKELRPESDAIALRSLEVGAPVRLDHGWDADGLPSGLEAPCLSVPVRSEIPEATAVALFGPHETGNDIDEDEREVLDQLAARAAAGYERVITALLRQEVAELKAQLTALQYGNRAELPHSETRATE